MVMAASIQSRTHDAINTNPVKPLTYSDVDSGSDIDYRHSALNNSTSNLRSQRSDIPQHKQSSHSTSLRSRGHSATHSPTTLNVPGAVAAPQSYLSQDGSYHGIKLTKDDLNTIKGCNWLTDNIISFYYQYLKYEIFGKHVDVLLIKPTVSYMLTLLTEIDDFKQSAISLKLHTRQIVFCPLNNESHWALLVYVRGLGRWFYYDSIQSLLQQQAEVLCARLYRFTSQAEPSLENIRDAEWRPAFMSMQTPQQNNSYDCGMYILAITHLLLDRYFDRHTLQLSIELMDRRRHGSRSVSRSRSASPAASKSIRKSSSNNVLSSITNVFKSEKTIAKEAAAREAALQAAEQQAQEDAIKQQQIEAEQAAIEESVIATELQPVQCVDPVAEAEQLQSVPAASCGRLKPTEMNINHSLSDSFITTFRKFVSAIAFERRPVDQPLPSPTSTASSSSAADPMPMNVSDATIPIPGSSIPPQLPPNLPKTPSERPPLPSSTPPQTPPASINSNRGLSAVSTLSTESNASMYAGDANDVLLNATVAMSVNDAQPQPPAPAQPPPNRAPLM